MIEEKIKQIVCVTCDDDHEGLVPQLSQLFKTEMLEIIGEKKSFTETKYGLIGNSFREQLKNEQRSTLEERVK